MRSCEPLAHVDSREGGYPGRVTGLKEPKNLSKLIKARIIPSMRKRIMIVLAATVTIFSLLLSRTGLNRLEGKEKPGESFRVEKINDGDTITVTIGRSLEKIRLIGIDAPEMGQEPWGLMAGEHLKAMINSSSRNVTIEYDVVKRDKYGRLLAYVWTKDGKMLNEAMLKDGYAILFTFPPNVKHVDEFIKAEKQARDRKIGIWAKDGLKETPSAYKKKHPRNK